jgi:hypothetical protein
VRNDRDQSVFEQESRILPAQFGAARSLEVSIDLPVTRLPPGDYLLSLVSRHGNESARRDARFRLE